MFDFILDSHSKLALDKNSGKMRMMPLRYILYLTHRCNLNCYYCYVDSKYIIKNELDTNDWFNIIEKLPRNSLISLIGGEPLLRKDFFKIFKKASDHNNGLVNFYTNGILLQEDIVKEIFKIKFLLLSISIDGYKEKYDKRLNYTGLFDKISNNIDYMYKYPKGKKTLTEIKVIILKDNLDDLPLLYKYAAERKFDYVSFSFLRKNYCDNPKYLGKLDDSIYERDFNTELYFDLEHFINIYKELESLQKKYSTMIRWSPRFTDIEQINHVFNNLNTNINKLYKPCYMPQQAVNILPDGTLAPCIPIPMGNILKQDLKTIINCEEYCKFRKRFYENKLFSFCNLCCDLAPKK